MLNEAKFDSNTFETSYQTETIIGSFNKRDEEHGLIREIRTELEQPEYKDVTVGTLISKRDFLGRFKPQQKGLTISFDAGYELNIVIAAF